MSSTAKSQFAAVQAVNAVPGCEKEMVLAFHPKGAVEGSENISGIPEIDDGKGH